MPYVNIKLVGKLTKEQKKELVKEITDTLHRVCNKAPEKTSIMIEEFSTENWGKNGVLLSE